MAQWVRTLSGLSDDVDDTATKAGPVGTNGGVRGCLRVILSMLISGVWSSPPPISGSCENAEYRQSIFSNMVKWWSKTLVSGV